MFSSCLVACLLLFITGIQAHLSITFPPPFRSKSNPLATDIDYNINSPISAAQFPCSGDLQTGGPSAATLTAGAQSKITFSTGAAHGGGSCQVSLSYDKKTFHVIHSFMGGCPILGGELPFTVPADAPAGEAVFAWTWNNKIGNREFYMNCAAVTIVGGGKKRQAPAVAFNDRPDIFVANLGNGCTVPEGTDAIYPNPGPDVTGSGSGSPITGCQPLNGVGNSQRGSGSGGSGAPAPAPSSVSSASQPAPPAGTTPALPKFTGSPNVSEPASTTQPGAGSSASPPAATATTPSTTTPGVLAESMDGSCGAGPKQKCRTGFCCSSTGFCGSSPLHCGSGCQAGFGQCGTVTRRWIPANYHGRRFPTGVAGRVRI